MKMLYLVPLQLLFCGCLQAERPSVMSTFDTTCFAFCRSLLGGQFLFVYAFMSSSSFVGITWECFACLLTPEGLGNQEQFSGTNTRTQNTWQFQVRGIFAGFSQGRNSLPRGRQWSGSRLGGLDGLQGWNFMVARRVSPPRGSAETSPKAERRHWGDSTQTQCRN